MQKKLKKIYKKLTKMSNTRWLSRFNALSSFTKNIIAILEIFLTDKNEKPQRLYKKWKKPRSLLFAFFMTDVLCVFNKLSLYFQQSNAKLRRGSLKRETLFALSMIDSLCSIHSKGLHFQQLVEMTQKGLFHVFNSSAVFTSF